MTDARWWERAACRHADPTDFDCDRRRHDVPSPERRADYARRACGACPVMAQCAADALDGSGRGTVRAGIWLSARGDDTDETEARLNNVALLLIAKGLPRSFLKVDYETGHVHVATGDRYNMHGARVGRRHRAGARARG